MQNQDPLNPMDNAQITSQMAQINTVSGIEKLNTSVPASTASFVQLQALAGASLVGHDVTLAGNRLSTQVGSGLEAGVDARRPGRRACRSRSSSPGARLWTRSNWAPRQRPPGLHLGCFQAHRHRRLPFRVSGQDRHRGRRQQPADARPRASRQRLDGSSGLVLQTQYSGSVAYSDVKAFN
jgi:flagellar basal-body rod modification protein FlgD